MIRCIYYLRYIHSANSTAKPFRVMANLGGSSFPDNFYNKVAYNFDNYID